MSVDYQGLTEVDTSDATCLKMPMAVLVNGSSYSAAEFFAAALGEYGVAKLVGQPTTGKGHFQSTFELSDVADGICKKMIERHPHVFGDVNAETSEQVLENWDVIKKRTKQQKSQTESMLSIPREFPALMRADKVQKKASKVGFDWDSADGAFQKVSEELNELKEAYAEGNQEHIHEELGDLLFSVVNVSRFVKVDSEEALTNSTDKFIDRFSKVEKMANEQGMDMKNTDLDTLDKLWDLAKKDKGSF